MSFKANIILKCHIKKIHEKKKPFKCNLCKKFYSRLNDLVVHVNYADAKIIKKKNKKSE